MSLAMAGDSVPEMRRAPAAMSIEEYLPYRYTGIGNAEVEGVAFDRSMVFADSQHLVVEFHGDFVGEAIVAFGGLPTQNTNDTSIL